MIIIYICIYNILILQLSLNECSLNYDERETERQKHADRRQTERQTIGADPLILKGGGGSDIKKRSEERMFLGYAYGQKYVTIV